MNLDHAIVITVAIKNDALTLVPLGHAADYATCKFRPYGQGWQYVQNLKITYFEIKSYCTRVTNLNLIFEAYRTFNL